MTLQEKVKTVAAIGACTTLGLLGASVAQAEVNVVFGTYMPATATLSAEAVIPWLDRVEELGGGEITTQFVGGGTVVTAKNNLFAAHDGLVDGATIAALYFPNELPVSNLFINMGSSIDNPLAASAALTETFAFDCPACDAEMERWNLHSLGAFVSPPYDLLCTKEVRSLADMKNLRVRASGHAVPLAAAMGATAANFTVPELYEALQRNQVDCTFGSVGWLTSYSLGDSAKFDIDIPGGSIVNPTLIDVRADLWETLTAKQRTALIEAAPIAVAGSTFGYLAQEQATLADPLSGITVIKPDADVLDALRAQSKLDIANAIATAQAKGVTTAPEIAEKFLANYAKWKGILKGDETREQFAELLADKIYSRMPVE